MTNVRTSLVTLIFLLVVLPQSLYPQTNQLELITVAKDTGRLTNFGRAVSGIGDVNLDGYDDVIIGNAGTESNNIGEAWILLGGNPMDSIPDFILSAGNEHDAFGGTVTSVGDVNGDGYEDFAVSANGFGAPSEYQKGRVYVYFGGALFDTIPDVVFTGEKMYSRFGLGLSKRLSNGDVNGDGYDDILISAPGYKRENVSVGKVYLYYGSEVIDTIPDWTKIGEGEDIFYFGYQLSIFDVNGDGYDDMLVGATPAPPHDNPDRNQLSIFFGSDDPDTLVDFFIEHSLSNPPRTLIVQDFSNDSIGDFTFKRSSNIDLFFGDTLIDTLSDLQLMPMPLTAIYRLANAGDVNGDGYIDIIFSAQGVAWLAGLYLGGSPMNGEIDWYIPGGHGFGTAVNGAGDVNGDGYDDIIIGESHTWATPFHWGKAWIFAGNPDLVDIGPAIREDDGRTIPEEFTLHQNFPNPFNSTTRIAYDIDSRSFIDVSIYDVGGKKVRTLVHQVQNTGRYVVVWDGKDDSQKDLSSGIYLATGEYGVYRRTVKVVLIR